MWWDVILDALYDTLKLFPFLLLLYILIELMEHNTRVGKPFRALSGKAAPLVGAATGLVPLCGFSVMAAKLYEHRHITLGTLLAVFVATSDEAFIVLLLSENMGWAEKGISLAAMIGIKFALGVAVGYLFDFLLRKHPLAPMPVHHEHEHEQEHEHEHEPEPEPEPEHEHEHEDHEHGDCACDELSVCEHKKESTLRLYLLSPLVHALEVAAFVLLVNLVFGFLFWGLGEENVVAFLQADGVYWVQPLVCALVGLVPNCASSVILAETYAMGGIAFGSCLGGLVAGAGLGYFVLLRRLRASARAVLIMLGMAAFGAAVGYAVNAVALVLPL